MKLLFGSFVVDIFFCWMLLDVDVEIFICFGKFFQPKNSWC